MEHVVIQICICRHVGFIFRCQKPQPISSQPTHRSTNQLTNYPHRPPKNSLTRISIYGRLGDDTVVEVNIDLQEKSVVLEVIPEIFPHSSFHIYIVFAWPFNGETLWSGCIYSPGIAVSDEDGGPQWREVPGYGYRSTGTVSSEPQLHVSTYLSL